MAGNVSTAYRLGSVVLTLALAACGSNAPPEAPSTSGDASSPSSTTAAPGDAAAGADQSGRASGPVSCGALSLVEGATISGEDLGTCFVDYLAFAGSGASEMRAENVSSRMVWRMGDEYEAYAEIDDGTRFTSTGGRAWVDFGDTGWIEADPSTPGLEVAFGLVQAWLERTAPELGRQMIASAPVWEVGPARSVSLLDGTDAYLTGVRAAAPFEWGGARIESMTFWMSEPGKIILQEANASAAGFTAASSTYYTQWGGEVEIPDPGA